ncbi:MAG: hypothetical protein CL842_10420 [Crocinitomicaceae bacterium]|nr:hypothetical protein [Crocinitomicaceae bacterium]|tara:strand:- start:252 stop:974 length:723 start_codon:yes stop_codon:yes gene_type:complete
MNIELEKYIDMALVDGVITESERTFLQKKAAQLGVDDDEFDFVLSAKIQMKQKELQTSFPPPPAIQSAPKNSKSNSQKEGEVYKCPSCGEVVDSFSINCISCGHEFRGSENRSKINVLILELKKIEDYEWNNNPYNGNNGNPRVDIMVRNGIASKQCTLIENFAVPNTKEDILEFLALAMPIGLKKFSWSEKFTHAAELQLQKSYKAKAQQIIIKARVALKKDTALIEQIENYSKQLGIK